MGATVLKRRRSAPDTNRMGRVHAVSRAAEADPAGRVVPAVTRALESAIAAVLLMLAAPLMLVLALAVRRSSHGPVLRREPATDARGRAVILLSFRTHLDGAHSEAHERVRAVLGAQDAHVLTGVGRLMRATRTDRLPRLLNVLAGQASLFRR